MRRVMVDMTVSILHHGHIRLLRKAKELGTVVVALTIDEEIKLHKGFTPALSFDERYEIVSSIKFVDEVVPSPWLITDEFMNAHGVELLIHGEDNTNPVSRERLFLIPRTPGISSTALRNGLL